jgi:hypothetical protein
MRRREAAAGRILAALAPSRDGYANGKQNRPIPAHPCREIGQPMAREELQKMWRLALVLWLLPSSIVLAGESRGQIQVGLTIIAIPNAAATGPVRAVFAGAVPLPRARPATIGRSDTAPTSAGCTRP